ncbi:hypothetical protein Sste5344_008205 [Sporothrix stenoceras]
MTKTAPISIRNVVSITSGEYHSFAIDTRGHVWGWGFNGFGEAGDSKSPGRDSASVSLPIKIKALSGRGVVHLAGGAHHSAAVTSDGTCLVWGRRDDGQLGVDFTPEELADPTLIRHDDRGRLHICLQPVVVDTIGPAAHVACGTDHTIFVTRSGTVYSTGFNAQGQLGLGKEYEDIDEIHVATQVVGGKEIQNQKRHITWAGASGQFSIVAGPRIVLGVKD